MNLSTNKGVNGTGTQRTNMWGRMFTRSDIGVGQWAPWWNLGFLWKEKYLETGEVFYCTSPNNFYKYELYSVPSFPTERSYAVRISYTYNPICKSLTDRNRKYNRTDECNGQMLLMADLLTDGGAAHEGPGWNVLWGDGHVDFQKNPHVLELIQKDVTGFSESNYMLFDMVIDALMTQTKR